MGKETNLEVKEYFLGNMGSTKDEQDLFSIHEPVLHDVAIEVLLFSIIIFWVNLVDIENAVDFWITESKNDDLNGKFAELFFILPT